MPVGGAKPKPEDQRRTRHQLTTDWTEVPNVPFEGGPDLEGLDPPAPLEEWPAGTLQWWSVIRRMPHCTLWGEADWQFALETALISAKFYTAADTRFSAELRQREKILGMTFDSRRDLRIRYVDPDAKVEVDEVKVAAMQDYRRMAAETA